MQQQQQQFNFAATQRLVLLVALAVLAIVQYVLYCVLPKAGRTT